MYLLSLGTLLSVHPLGAFPSYVTLYSADIIGELVLVVASESFSILLLTSIILVTG